jgi:hypothetical protein
VQLTLQKGCVKGSRAGSLALGIHLDKPNPYKPVDQKGQDQRREKKCVGKIDGRRIEIQAVFAAVEINAEQVAAPGEEKNYNRSGHCTVVPAQMLQK